MAAFDRLSRVVPNGIDQNEHLEKRMSRKSTHVKADLSSDDDDQTKKRRVSEYLGEEDEDVIDEHDRWKEEDIVLPYLIAYVIGLGNIWRFPYLCDRYGGSAFIIPYIAMTLLAAYPYVYLELLVGQYAQVGAIAVFKFMPLFKGVGICMTLLAMMTSFNIQSVVAWCLFYLFQCVFHSPLPWISCDNGFGRLPNGQIDKTHTKPATDDMNWNTVNCTEFYVEAGSSGAHHRLPGAEYFLGRVQRMWKSGFADRADNYTGDNGAIGFGFGAGDLLEVSYNADTMCALLATFLIVQIFLQRGTKINGTVIVLLVVVPYIIMVLLFYRSSGLNGAWQGLAFYFTPKYEALASPETWWRAAEQVFRSSGAGLGIYLTIASRNRHSRNVLADATKIIIINTSTSLFSACVIFMLLGHVRVNVNNDVEVLHGPELVFEVMADVLGVLAKPNFYSSFFYIMLFFIGLTNVTTILVCAKNALLEVMPVHLRYKSRSKLIIGTISVLSLIQSSSNLTRGGLHTFHYIETFIWSFSAIISAILFLIGIVWFWGLEEIVWASIMMGQREPGIYFQLCWKYFGVIVLIIIFGLALDPSSHEIRVGGETVEISDFLKTIGYLLGVLPLSAVLIWGFRSISMQQGNSFKNNLLLSVTPTRDHEEVIETGTGKRATFSHYFYLYASTNENRCRLFCGGPEGARLNQVQPYDPPTETTVKETTVKEVTLTANDSGKSQGSGRNSQHRIPIVIIDDVDDNVSVTSNGKGSTKSAAFSIDVMVHKRGACCTIV